MTQIFLLSPAYAGGKRAGLVLNERAEFPLAAQLRGEGVPLGEVFAFLSGLYFRGKLAYCRAFAAPPEGAPAALVIAPGRGMVSPDSSITLDDLRQMAAVPVDLAEPRYREPLERDARLLGEMAGPACRIVLLGSVATMKYVEPLVRIFGDRLVFPAEFVGRGDMSRGGLMLRAARAGVELAYVPAAGAVRHGPRPPRLGRDTV
jgi:hypothetical protein